MGPILTLENLKAFPNVLVYAGQGPAGGWSNQFIELDAPALPHHDNAITILFFIAAPILAVIPPKLGFPKWVQ